MAIKPLLAALLFLLVSAVNAQGTAIPLEPASFCLSALDQCTPDRLKPITTKVGFDVRPLNEGKNEPITLVFNVPPEVAGKKDLVLLVAPQFRDHCFQLNNDRGQTVCSHRELLTLPITPETRQIFTQNVQGDDVQLAKPNLRLGSLQETHAEVLRSRTPVLGLLGWYAFLSLAAAFQLLTARNRLASFCISMLAVSVFFRTLSSSHYGFSGLTLLGSLADRRMEYLTIAMLCIFGVGFYGTFIGKRLWKIRLALVGLCTLAGVFILLAQQPQHVRASLRFVQFCTLPALALVVTCALLALKTLRRREQFILLTGLAVVVMGALVDIGMSFMGLPFLLDGRGLTTYCIAFEALFQFILIALLNDAAHQESQHYQKEQIDTQALLVRSLEASESELNTKVKRRTAALETANQEILNAYHTAETAREQTAKALIELKDAQAQLIQSEKMASLGLLVSNVAHEINTPISAIQSSGATVAESMRETLENLPALLEGLGLEPRTLFLDLVLGAMAGKARLSTKDERALVKKITAEIASHGIEGSSQKARLLVRLGAQNNTEKYLPLFRVPEADSVLKVASNIAGVLSGIDTINLSSKKISGIVVSLRELSGDNRTTAMFKTALTHPIEKAILALSHLTKNVEIIRNFEDLAPLNCDPEALQHVFSHLILNGLHAMQHQGKLEITLKSVDSNVEVQFTDCGCGMPLEVSSRIFDPFFTTRASGEGGGMGLAIAKKIVEQHRGRIEVQTAVGAGTTVRLVFPYAGS